MKKKLSNRAALNEMEKMATSNFELFLKGTIEIVYQEGMKRGFLIGILFGIGIGIIIKLIFS